MRNIIFLTLISMLSGLISNDALAQKSASVGHATRYVYCNIYLENACFGIAAGDSLKMEIPVDFVLDTVSLRDGAKAVIYEGNSPQNVFAGKTPKRCPNAHNAYQCRYIKSAKQYDLVYQPTAKARVIHVRLSGVTANNQANVADFLLGFRQCHSVGQSEQCTDDQVFKDIDW